MKTVCPPPPVPSHTPSEWTMLWHGLRAQPLALCMALAATWTGMILAIELAGIGLVAGSIAGAWAAGSFLATHSLGSAFTSAPSTPMDVGASGTLMAMAIAAGGAAGALGGFAAIMSGGVLHPAATAAYLICGALLTLTGCGVAWDVELWVLARRGYRRLSWDEWDRLTPLLSAALQALEIPGTEAPVLVMQDSVIPTAHAYMQAIVLSTGLLTTLDDTALAGILAHELAHWRAGDPAGYRLVWLAALPLVVIETVLTWIGTRLAGSRVVGAGLTASLAWLLFWPVHVCVQFLLAPLYAGRAREQEYAADAVAGAAGDLYREGLRAALTTLASFEAPPSRWEEVLVRTHPPAALRLERLASAAEHERRAVVRAHYDAHGLGARARSPR